MYVRIMATPRKYFNDHFVLLLLSTNIFVALISIAIVLARLSAAHSSTYIVQYRPSLGINAFKTGDLIELLSFIGFAIIALAVHFVLSKKAYPLNRHLAIGILALGVLLLVLNIIVSNALLALH